MGSAVWVLMPMLAFLAAALLMTTPQENAAADCRSSRRVNNAAGNRNSDVGFRIVMTR